MSPFKPKITVIYDDAPRKTTSVVKCDRCGVVMSDVVIQGEHAARWEGQSFVNCVGEVIVR